MDFLDHSTQIPVPTFTLSIAFPFPFIPFNRQSILPLLKVGSWFLFQPGHLFSSLAQAGSGKILPSLQQSPCPVPHQVPHLQRCLWASLGSGFTKAEPSPVPLLLAASPSHNPFKLCSLDHFPGSSSWFTRCAVLLFSLPLVLCLSWCCIISSCLHFAAV